MNKNFKIYENKGLSGLANCGNTCYINSCMQVLSHTYELNNIFNDDYNKLLNDNIDALFLKQWDELRKMLWNTNCIVAPMGFLKALFYVAKQKKRDLFAGFQQNDVQEFLLFVIDCFHNALSKKVNMEINGNSKSEKDIIALQCYNRFKDMYSKDYSPFIQIFYGMQITQIKDINDKKILSNVPEPFSILNVPVLETTNTIYDCIDEYCKSELLTGDNAWFNDKTKEKVDVEKNICFWDLPNVLIISLKRWNIMGRKNNKVITSPIENVDFSKYVIGYHKEQYIYDLYGICNHSGNVLGGHYTAYVKNANSKWYQFNDTSVKEINSDNLLSNQSYCLFYRKRTNNKQ